MEIQQSGARKWGGKVSTTGFRHSGKPTTRSRSRNPCHGAKTHCPFNIHKYRQVQQTSRPTTESKTKFNTPSRSKGVGITSDESRHGLITITSGAANPEELGSAVLQ